MQDDYVECHYMLMLMPRYFFFSLLLLPASFFSAADAILPADGFRRHYFHAADCRRHY